MTPLLRSSQALSLFKKVFNPLPSNLGNWKYCRENCDQRFIFKKLQLGIFSLCWFFWGIVTVQWNKTPNYCQQHEYICHDLWNFCKRCYVLIVPFVRFNVTCIRVSFVTFWGISILIWVCVEHVIIERQYASQAICLQHGLDRGSNVFPIWCFVLAFTSLFFHWCVLHCSSQ